MPGQGKEAIVEKYEAEREAKQEVGAEIRKICRAIFLLDGICQDNVVEQRHDNTDLLYVSERFKDVKIEITKLANRVSSIAEKWGEDSSPGGRIYDENYIENGTMED